MGRRPTAAERRLRAAVPGVGRAGAPSLEGRAVSVRGGPSYRVLGKGIACAAMTTYCAPCISDLALLREAVTAVSGTASCAAHAVLVTHPTDVPGRRRARPRWE